MDRSLKTKRRIDAHDPRISGSRYESAPIIRRPIRYSAHACRMKLCISHFSTGRLTIRPWRSSPDAICGKATQLSVGKSERQLCDPSLVSSSLSRSHPPPPPASCLFNLVSTSLSSHRDSSSSLLARDPLRGLMS